MHCKLLTFQLILYQNYRKLDWSGPEEYPHCVNSVEEIWIGYQSAMVLAIRKGKLSKLPEKSWFCLCSVYLGGGGSKLHCKGGQQPKKFNIMLILHQQHQNLRPILVSA